MPRSKSLLATAFLFACGCAFAAQPTLDVMPLPEHAQLQSGRLAVGPGFLAVISGPSDALLKDGLERTLSAWEKRATVVFPRAGSPSAPRTPVLTVSCEELGPVIPAVDADEAYSLEVTTDSARLSAKTRTGVLRGLATLTQLLGRDAQGWYFPAVSIQDAPRFGWRGLLIDVGRHWEPIEVIERNLDGMALVKLNVLHFHLTEDQGFRIESLTHPELQAQGSDGHYFTQAQIREIIAYAAARGIRVVPEFDMPGHAASWLVSHPELASGPGPFQIVRKWGIFDPVFDPTNEATYALLDDFLGEMASLFPDPFIHIGGDENNGKEWDANPKIQAFIKDHGLSGNPALQAYFNQKISAILGRHGKKMIGWDEILNKEIPPDTVIQSWRGPKGLVQAATMGFHVILSNGYYIDSLAPTSDYYKNDPLPVGSPLTPDQQKRVLGGEATMWGEWVDSGTIDSRIWPTTAAIAERLWSPKDVTDIDDMYRRLAGVSNRLDEAGTQHLREAEAITLHLAGNASDKTSLESLRVFVAAVESSRLSQRRKDQKGHIQSTPLTDLTDATHSDNRLARSFAADVRQFLAGERSGESTTASTIRAQLQAWMKAGRDVASLATHEPTLAESGPIAQNLADASSVGLEALESIASRMPLDPARITADKQVLDLAAKPRAAVVLPMIGALRELLAAAGS